MSSYAIFFDYDNKTYRLPVNPEEIEETSTQAIERYEVLKLGEVAIPTHMELAEYSFECEFPSESMGYVETPSEFKNADFYIALFKKWRDKLVPVRFIASNNIGDDINTLVLIEEITIIEKAGEEGDKYVSFELLEYKKFGKKSEVVIKVDKNKNKVAKVVPKKPTPKVNPKTKGTHIVRKGDTLWAISKRYYGKGSQYPKIFNANRNIIKNANLIYPNQKLVIP